jgi:hypothetical protein
MRIIQKFDRRERGWKKYCWACWFSWLAILVFPAPGIALPARLILALDGVSYRDLAALQQGIGCTNALGKIGHRQAFTPREGYFPVSRMISTFPSVSDVAWTDIFGDRPQPGYQRTYYSAGANREISINGVTTSTEHERQMNWQVEDSYVRLMGYVHPVHTYKYELNELFRNFWNATNLTDNYYAYIRASDDAQHLNGDIIQMLCLLDADLQKLRSRYRVETGRDLQILVLSDHGHNHAGRSRLAEVRPFLRGIGYRISNRISGPEDVVLPTAGIEDWVEIHNAPGETEKLARRLCRLDGVDLVTAQDPDRQDSFVVMNAAGDRAVIQWRSTNNSFCYLTGHGDPIDYLPVLQELARKHQLDADGFASAEDWLAATLTHRYPVAPERITRAFKNNSLNPATILISLKNGYVNAGWWVLQGSRLVSCGSTHGGLDDLNSDGIVLSNFAATHDTSSDRVSGQFDDFPGVRDFRSAENGGEFVNKSEQALTRIAHVPFDSDSQALPGDQVCLRMWSPEFLHLDRTVPVAVAIDKVPRFVSAPSGRGDRKLAVGDGGLQTEFSQPINFRHKDESERIYKFPDSLVLNGQTQYRISGKIRGDHDSIQIFAFNFHTGPDGRPLAY